MVKNTSPQMSPQQPSGPPDVPQHPCDPSSPFWEAEQGQRRRCVYKRRTQPTTTRRKKTQLISREGESVPGDAEAEDQNRKP